MYCSGSEFKYSGTIAKNECSIMLEICPTPNPTLNLPDRVDKCKTYYKNVFVEATVPFELPFCILYNFPNLCRHVHLCIYQTLLSKATYRAFRLYICIVSMCVLWESNPQPLHC